MDRAISASEANRRFSGVLRDVKGGETFVVTSRGAPVARITPIEHDDVARAAAREALYRHWKEIGDEPIIVAPWSRDELYDRDDKDYPWRK